MVFSCSGIKPLETHLTFEEEKNFLMSGNQNGQFLLCTVGMSYILHWLAFDLKWILFWTIIQWCFDLGNPFKAFLQIPYISHEISHEILKKNLIDPWLMMASQNNLGTKGGKAPLKFFFVFKGVWSFKENNILNEIGWGRKTLHFEA